MLVFLITFELHFSYIVMFFVIPSKYPFSVLFMSPPIQFTPSNIQYANYSSLIPSVYFSVCLKNSSPVIGDGFTTSSSSVSSFYSSCPCTGISSATSFDVSTHVSSCFTIVVFVVVVCFNHLLVVVVVVVVIFLLVVCLDVVVCFVMQVLILLLLRYSTFYFIFLC